MLCRRCGTANADEKEFCRQCGASLHWHAVVGPSSSPDRRGVVGLVVGAAALVLGLIFAYLPPFGLLAGSSATARPAESPTAVASTAPASTGSPAAPAEVTPQLTPGALAPSAPTPSSAPSTTPSLQVLPPGPRPNDSAQPAPAPYSAQTGITVPFNSPLPPTSTNPTTSTNPIGAVPADRDAAISYLNVVAPNLVGGRAALVRFLSEWNAPTGLAARLRSNPDAQTAAQATQSADKAQEEIGTAAMAVQQRQAPPSLQPLQGILVQAFDSARAAIGRAAAVSRQPEPSTIDEVSTLLSQADRDLARAASELDAAKVRMGVP